MLQTTATSARCDERDLHVVLSDGRRLSAPLWWYPRLIDASHEARNRIELMPMGLHRPEIDEDIYNSYRVRGA
jgi:hypothetical protein